MMPYARRSWQSISPNLLIAVQQDYDPSTELALAQENIARFNPGQKTVYDQILASVMNADGKLYFVHGPGGTGKSFVWNTLAHGCRANGKIVLCVASSGIASVLLPGGRTSHSTFKIPIDLDESSTCNFRKQSPRAELMHQVSLFY